VVFDLDDAKSLDEARDWFIQISLHSFKDIPKILVGNKSDLWGEEELAKIIEGYRIKIESLTK
jgi:GTPase SAR1 family protein